MKINKVIFCEEINEIPDNQGGRKVALINPTTLFNLSYIPSSFSFSLMVMATGAFERNVNMMFKLLNPRTGKEVFTANALIPPQPEVPGIPKENIGLNLNLNLRNVEIEDPGDYTFECHIEGDRVFSESLSILRRKK